MLEIGLETLQQAHKHLLNYITRLGYCPVCECVRHKHRPGCNLGETIAEIETRLGHDYRGSIYFAARKRVMGVR